MIDLDGNRLQMAEGFGATSVVNSAAEDAVARVLSITEGAGVDLAIEAVGTPAAFDTCQAIVGAGGRIANIGVHGKPVQCTSRNCGTGTSRSRRAWSIPSRRRCCSN